MSAGPTYIFDHVDRRFARLVEALQKPNIQALVRMYADSIQELEDNSYALIMERLLDAAVGAQLDQWGELVGETRDGLNDERYRAFIDARLLINSTNGEPDNLTAVLALLGEATGPVWYHPLYPAAYWLSFPTETAFSDYDKSKITSRVLDATPAGVGLDGIVITSPFAFSFEGDPEGLGFGEGEFGGLL